jgi:hypothetical protein
MGRHKARVLRRASQDGRVRNIRMKWPKWSIATSNSGDPMPILFGSIFMFVSLPGFVMMLVNSDRNAGVIKTALLVVLGGGIIIGALFILLGLRICSFPGSRLYRITHGRIFSR